MTEFNLNLNLNIDKIAQAFGVTKLEALERIDDFINEIENSDSENDNVVVTILEMLNVFDS